MATYVDEAITGVAAKVPANSKRTSEQFVSVMPPVDLAMAPEGEIEGSRVNSKRIAASIV